MWLLRTITPLLRIITPLLPVLRSITYITQYYVYYTDITPISTLLQYMWPDYYASAYPLEFLIPIQPPRCACQAHAHWVGRRTAKLPLGLLRSSLLVFTIKQNNIFTYFDVCDFFLRRRRKLFAGLKVAFESSHFLLTKTIITVSSLRPTFCAIRRLAKVCQI